MISGHYFNATLSDADWDERTGGWRCDALGIPGATVKGVFFGAKQASARDYSVEGRSLVWQGGERPIELVVKIELTTDLDSIEARKLELERQKVDLQEKNYGLEEQKVALQAKNLELETGKTAFERKWRFITAIGTVGAFGLGFVVPKPKERDSTSPWTLIPSKNVVPQVAASSVQALPEETSGDQYFDLFKDISVFDLRSWRPTSKTEMQTRHSPANYTNYLNLRKKKDQAKYVARYSTSGYAIDMRSITHTGVLYTTTDTQHEGNKQYAIEVNVAAEPVGKDFLLVVEGTYWNGFANEAEESASTYTDSDITKLGELGLAILFPEGKPFTSFELLQRQKGWQDFVPLSEGSKFYADKSQLFIYWSITTRTPDTEYKVVWKW